MKLGLAILGGATATFALTAAVADASVSTEWVYGGPKVEERSPIPEGTTVEVPTATNKLYLHLHVPQQSGVRITCALSGRATFTNRRGAGRDALVAARFTCSAECGTVKVAPILPWSSVLVGSEIPLLDVWSNVALELTYCGKRLGRFTGMLEAVAGDHDPEGEAPELVDEPDSELRFKCGAEYPNSILRNEAGATLTAVGILKDGVKGKEVVVAELG